MRFSGASFDAARFGAGPLVVHEWAALVSWIRGTALYGGAWLARNAGIYYGSRRWAGCGGSTGIGCLVWALALSG